ncbi:MAG: DUF1080 domain-containing protein [Opitutae bacterium]|nr:DUF1080 domain-containing protein [Opitutae bacterium]
MNNLAVFLILLAPLPVTGKKIDLLKGDGLDQWEAFGKAQWKVSDGVLEGGQDGDPKRSGVLATKETFRDFDLEFEYLIDEHGKYNSGVYFRRGKTKDDRKGPSYQLNLGRGKAGEFVGLFLDRWLDKGDEEDRIRKPKEWNNVRLLVVGPKIKAWLNGELIVEYVDPAPRPDLARAGTIALQTYGAEGHAGWVKFRKMRIRKIN